MTGNVFKNGLKPREDVFGNGILDKIQDQVDEIEGQKKIRPGLPLR